MGTIKKFIEIDDEDIMHLKQTEKELYNIFKKNKKPVEFLEIFTIQSIIKKWNETEVYKEDKDGN